MIYFKEREYQNLELKDLDNFVFDLDGTLLNSEAKIITKNLEAILNLKALGKNIFIATGRHFHSARTYLDQVIPNFPVITANGAAIWDLKNIQVLKTFFIDKDIAKEIYDALVEWKYDFSIYTPDKMIGHNANKTGFFEKRNYIERLGDKYKEGNISHLINDLQVCKFYVLMDSNDDHTFHNINSIIKKYGDKVHMLRFQIFLM
ncbi:HAD-IIB family hydrolase [Mycoplasmopsis cynos]|nr:HAD-IIB family hydrolase [Mycoplasmopsis cynos]